MFHLVGAQAEPGEEQEELEAVGSIFTHVTMPWWEALAATRTLRLLLEAQSPRKRAAWTPPLPLAADFSSNLPYCSAPTPRTWCVWAWPSGRRAALSLQHAKFSTNSKNSSTNKGEHRACCSFYMRQFPSTYWHTSLPFLSRLGKRTITCAAGSWERRARAAAQYPLAPRSPGTPWSAHACLRPCSSQRD